MLSINHVRLSWEKGGLHMVSPPTGRSSSTPRPQVVILSQLWLVKTSGPAQCPSQHSKTCIEISKVFPLAIDRKFGQSGRLARRAAPGWTTGSVSRRFDGETFQKYMTFQRFSNSQFLKARRKSRMPLSSGSFNCRQVTSKGDGAFVSLADSDPNCNVRTRIDSLINV